MSTILVTGGAGYIGSHMCVALVNAGHEVVALDNLCNSSSRSIDAVTEITGSRVDLYRADLRDRDALARIFAERDVAAVIHFAGLKAVGESVADPLLYYDNNVAGTLRLVECMSAAGVKTLIFSSSATVYGASDDVPFTESAPTAPENPYGRTKLVVEQLLRDLCSADAEWRVSLLRYFNPVGAHPSGMLGEDPRGVPNNLVPFIAQVAVGRRPSLRVFGDDYPTPDGTGVRDYIHVVDLAAGHLEALSFLEGTRGAHAHNLGTGTGYSVLEVIEAFAAAAGKHIPYEIVARRPGDVAVSYADPTKARRELGWQTERNLNQMCEDVWRWQAKNPNGFG
jgi:UDP-glucose 4-epimerase